MRRCLFAFNLAFRNFIILGKEKTIVRGMLQAIFGIAIALIPLIVVIQVSNGMIVGITERYLEIASYHIQLRNFHADKNDTAGIVAELREHAVFSHVAPFVEGDGLIYNKNDQIGVRLRGISHDDFHNDVKMLEYYELLDGDYIFSDNSVLLSQGLADNLQLSIGDDLFFLTSFQMPSGRLIFRPQRLQLEGIVSTGYYELDSITGLISYNTAEKLFPKNTAYKIGIKLDYPYEELSKKIELSQEISGSAWRSYSWYELNRSMYESFSSTRAMLILIMAIIIIVSSVNISSSLVMLILDKQETIAMLKCIGMGKQSLVLSFTATGFLAGLVGAAIGALAGLLIAVNINELAWLLEQVLRLFLFPFRLSWEPVLDSSYYLSYIPIKIPFLDFFFAVLFTVVTATISSIFPARKAATIKPVEIFQKH